MDREESVIPSVTETLRMQRKEHEERKRGIETAASRRSQRMLQSDARGRVVTNAGV